MQSERYRSGGGAPRGGVTADLGQARSLTSVRLYASTGNNTPGVRLSAIYINSMGKH